MALAGQAQPRYRRVRFQQPPYTQKADPNKCALWDAAGVEGRHSDEVGLSLSLLRALLTLPCEGHRRSQESAGGVQANTSRHGREGSPCRPATSSAGPRTRTGGAVRPCPTSGNAPSPSPRPVPAWLAGYEGRTPRACSDNRKASSTMGRLTRPTPSDVAAACVQRAGAYQP